MTTQAEGPDKGVDNGADKSAEKSADGGAEATPPEPARPAPNLPATRVLQTIDLRQDRTATAAALLVAATVATVIGGLWFGHFSKTESVRGIVAATGGFARLDAPRSGVITKILVAQGDPVKVGAPVYAMRMGTASAGGESAVESEIRNLTLTRKGLEEEVARATSFIDEATRQQKKIDAERHAFYDSLLDQTRRSQAAADKSRGVVRRVAAYVQRGDATRDLLEQHERTTFEYERQAAELRLKNLEYQRQDSERQREFQNLIATKQSQRATAQSQIETTDSRLAALRTEGALEVQAQNAGTVLAVTAKVGDSINAGQLVAAVGDPAAAPVITVDAPSRAVGLAKVGQRVILKYDAFPYKTFGIHHGTISYISEAAVRAPGSEAAAALGLDPRPVALQSAYRIEIIPDRTDIEAYGEKVPIKIGSTLTADIIVEKRRLLDWMLDPIRALRGR